MIGLLFATATYYPLYLRLAGVKDVAPVSFGVFVLILATVFTFNMLGTTSAELFPTRVRYTAMSMAFKPRHRLLRRLHAPHNTGSRSLAKNPLAGVILYTYVVAAVALLTALLLLPETEDKALD